MTGDQAAWGEANLRCLMAAIGAVRARAGAAGEAAAPGPASRHPESPDPPAAFERLRAGFGLSGFELAAVLLAAGVELDPGAGRPGTGGQRHQRRPSHAGVRATHAARCALGRVHAVSGAAPVAVDRAWPGQPGHGHPVPAQRAHASLPSRSRLPARSARRPGRAGPPSGRASPSPTAATRSGPPPLGHPRPAVPRRRG